MKFENNKRDDPSNIFVKNNNLISFPKINLESSGQIIPTKPNIPAQYTLIDVKKAANITNIMLYLFAADWFLNISLLSSLKAFSLGIKIEQIINVNINKITKNLSEISLLENPPVKIRVIS